MSSSASSTYVCHQHTSTRRACARCPINWTAATWQEAHLSSLSSARFVCARQQSVIGKPDLPSDLRVLFDRKINLPTRYTGTPPPSEGDVRCSVRRPGPDSATGGLAPSFSLFAVTARTLHSFKGTGSESRCTCLKPRERADFWMFITPENINEI